MTYWHKESFSFSVVVALMLFLILRPSIWRMAAIRGGGRRTLGIPVVQAFAFQKRPFPHLHSFSTTSKNRNVPKAVPTNVQSPAFANYEDDDPYEDHIRSAAALHAEALDESTESFSQEDDLDEYDRQATQSTSSFGSLDHQYSEWNEEEATSRTVPVDANSPILQHLNPNQIDAVTKPLYSVTRVIAGPGSGKTRVLTNRIAWLLQQNSHDRILAVTFTRKAAGEMQERVHKLLLEQEQFTNGGGTPMIAEEHTSTEDALRAFPADLRRVTLGTFHSVCTKILRWNGDLLDSLPSIQADLAKSFTPVALNKDFNILDAQEQKRIVKELLEEFQISIVRENVKMEQIMKCLATMKLMIASGKDPYIRLEGDPPFSPQMQIAQKIYGRFREKSLASNSLDFDDLLCLARELLLVHPYVQASLRQRWRHVFVDEYQDTSEIQVDLIKMLTVDSLFVVGDADQSIYAWRGAHVESLYDFEHVFKDFHRDGVSTVYLMENYRSTPSIVQAAQKVISLSSDQSGADKLRQKMIPQRSGGSVPRIISFESGDEEAHFLVNHIRKNLSSGEYSASRKVAFIYRTNVQSRLLEEACVRFNVPYVIFGSFTSFYNSHEIKDCLCFLRWLRNGRDRVAMLRAIETPKRGLGDTAIRAFDEYCSLVNQFCAEHYSEVPPPSPLEILFYLTGKYSSDSVKDSRFPDPAATLSSRPLKLLIEFSRQMVLIRDASSYSTVSKTIQFIVEALDLRPYFNKISKSKDEYEERLANVDELTKAAMRYDADGVCLPLGSVEQASTTDDSNENQSPLGSFLDDVSLITEVADRKAEESGAERFVVNLMTIHASKGMEFDSVFFVGVEDRTIPSSQALEQGEGSVPYEEEKRLCYVAMTRAKSELIMTWRQSATLFTPDGMKTVDRNRSRFLDVLVAKKTSASSSPESGNAFKRSSVTKKAQHIQAWSAKSRSFATTSTSTAVKSPPSNKFSGTASVYKRESPTLPISPPTPRRPQAPTATRRSASTARAGVDRGMSPAPSRTPDPNPATTPSSINANWFFPIGSKVRHKQLGEGVVLPPPAALDAECWSAVRVEFHTGEQREFPVQTTDLSPIVL